MKQLSIKEIEVLVAYHQREYMHYANSWATEAGRGDKILLDALEYLDGQKAFHLERHQELHQEMMDRLEAMERKL